MQRLKSRNDFKRLSKCTQKVIGKYFIVVYMIDNMISEPYIGITVSKKVGNAVVRNRVKRRIRAFLREYVSPNSNINFICNIIALSSVINTEWSMFKKDLNNCIDKIFRIIETAKIPEIL